MYQNGIIQPVGSVPADWREGDRLLVAHEETVVSADELDRWVAEVQEVTASISEEDHQRAMAAIAQHRAEAKEWVRREWGLPE